MPALTLVPVCRNPTFALRKLISDAFLYYPLTKVKVCVQNCVGGPDPQGSPLEAQGLLASPGPHKPLTLTALIGAVTWTSNNLRPLVHLPSHPGHIAHVDTFSLIMFLPDTYR